MIINGAAKIKSVTKRHVMAAIYRSIDNNEKYQRLRSRTQNKRKYEKEKRNGILSRVDGEDALLSQSSTHTRTAPSSSVLATRENGGGIVATIDIFSSRRRARIARAARRAWRARARAARISEKKGEAAAAGNREENRWRHQQRINNGAWHENGGVAAGRGGISVDNLL